MKKSFLKHVDQFNFRDIEKLSAKILSLKKVKQRGGTKDDDPLKVSSTNEIRSLLDYGRYKASFEKDDADDKRKEFYFSIFIRNEKNSFHEVAFADDRAKELNRFEHNEKDSPLLASLRKSTKNKDQEALLITTSLYLLDLIYDLFVGEKYISFDRVQLCIGRFEEIDMCIPAKDFHDFLIIRKILSLESEMKIYEHFLAQKLVGEGIRPSDKFSSEQVAEVEIILERLLQQRIYELEAKIESLFQERQSDIIQSFYVSFSIDEICLDDRDKFRENLKKRTLKSFFLLRFPDSHIPIFSRILDFLLALGIFPGDQKKSLFKLNFDESSVPLAFDMYLNSEKFITAWPVSQVALMRKYLPSAVEAICKKYSLDWHIQEEFNYDWVQISRLESGVLTHEFGPFPVGWSGAFESLQKYYGSPDERSALTNAEKMTVINVVRDLENQGLITREQLKQIWENLGIIPKDKK
ncbi:MAG: hypothetical protein V4598_05610 [Bdellovibrionota bacterium]